MGLFNDLTVRENGQDILAGWFNLIRLAGIAVEAFLGSFIYSTSSVSIANNQTSAANVTGLTVSSATERYAVAEIRIRRVSTGGGATERVSVQTLFLTYNTLAATWALTKGSYGPDEHGMDFTVTAAGQVQYASDNMTGTYDTTNSKMDYNLRKYA